LKVIGQGGFGKTFLAQDEGKPSKPRCVIKQFIYDDPATLREAQRLFEQEAVRLDDLGKHPQIPELLAHWEQEGRQYLVQEFIDGENLLQELKRVGRFSEAKIKELLLDLLPVLQFIHAGQVIHRDIKPENVIRRRSDGRLVIVDFGAAKMASQTALAKTGTTIGSAGYAAPEQTFGKALYASDIYSLGVSCLHLITDVNPLTMYDPVEGFAWRDFLVNQKVSNELGAVLDKMTQPSVKQRYQSVAETLQVLQANVPIPTPSNPKITTSLIIPEFLLRKNRTQEFEFEYVKAHLVTESSGFLGLGTKTKVELDRKRGKAQYICVKLGDGVTMDLVFIPAGKFKMGSNDDREKPIHDVTLKEFWIGKYAVTNAQWEAVMGTKPWESSNVKFHGQNQPVINVSWNDCIKFSQTLSQKTLKYFNLPSESQWEYACLAGDGNTDFHFGDVITPDLVNYDGSRPYGDAPKGEYRERTVDVQNFTPNAYGLYQMHGNVCEWCEDVWHENYYGAPNDGTAWLNGGEKDRHIMRGGSWFTNALNCISKVRYAGSSNGSYDHVGFRVVVSSIALN
jgi:formylglycine-generating enzyme required for sulfatase activity